MAEEVEVQVTTPELAVLAENVNKLGDDVAELKGMVEEQTLAIEPLPQKFEDGCMLIFDAAKMFSEGGGTINPDATTGGASPNALDLVEGEVGTEIQQIRDVISESKDVAMDTADITRSLQDGMSEVTKAMGGGETGMTRGIISSTRSLGKLVDVLEGAGVASGAGGGVISVLGKFASGLGVAVASVELINAAMDNYQKVRDVAISQTGTDEDITLGFREWSDRQFRSTFSPLTDEETKSMQEALIAGRAKFGTDAYTEGMAFSTGARLNYGMDSARAARLYTDAVVRGTASTEQLNSTMDNLSQIAKDSNATMVELTATYEQSVKDISKAWGGQGAEVATELAEYMKDNESLKFMSGAVSRMASQSQYGSRYTELMNQYSEEGYDFSGSAIKATYQMMLSGQVGSEWLALRGLDEYGGNATFMEYVDQERWDELSQVLNNMYSSAPGDWAAMLVDLQNAGIDISMTSTPDQVIGTFRNMKEGLNELPTASVKEARKRSGATQTSNEAALANPYLYSPEGISYDTAAGSMSLGGASVSEAGLGDIESGNMTEEAAGTALALVRGKNLSAGSNFRYLDKESQDDLMREAVEMYRDYGGQEKYGSFDEFLSTESSDVSSMIKDYSSSFGPGMTNGEQMELRGKIDISFSGELGKYVYQTGEDFRLQYSYNNGSD